MIKVKKITITTTNGTVLGYTNCMINFLTNSSDFPILLICKDNKNICFPLVNCTNFNYELADDEVLDLSRF